MSWDNTVLPNVRMRLRDARFGSIVDAQLTDKSGLFTFREVPGTYVVEIVSSTQTVLAASRLISLNAGEATSVVVRLPSKPSPFATLVALGGSSAVVLLPLAVIQGIAAIVPAGNPVSER